MPPPPDLVFPPFHLDPAAECLRRGTQVIALRRKTFALLRYLVEHAGELVTKEALLDAVWPDAQVSEGGLTVCVTELRKALGDDTKAPRFIETVHGRGYRWIAPLATTQPGQSSKFKVQSPNQHPRPTLVGREAELTQLHGWFEKALGGERQVVFVTGEAGIGKTTLVDAFLEQLNQEARDWKLDFPPPRQVSSLKSLAWARPVYRTVRRGRGLPANAGSAGAAGARAWWRAAHGAPGPVCTHLAGADAPLLSAAEVQGCNARSWAPRGSGCCGRWPRPSRR